MIMSDRELFKTVFDRFAESYPRRDLKMQGTLVYVDGQCKFNTDGFNLLYNLLRLCECLEKELL